MTGLLNHNASLDYLKRMKRHPQRYNKGLAVIMADIDLFKFVNDTFGHVAGDKVITEVAAVMQNTIRGSDICGRFGGEEFIFILPESDMNNTRELAERIRENIQALAIPEIENTPVTASFVIAVYDGNNPDDNLLIRADNALYQAKKSGRNQVQPSIMNIVTNKITLT
jgi:diguanylate cyclase (GGDEF)-like protein